MRATPSDADLFLLKPAGRVGAVGVVADARVAVPSAQTARSRIAYLDNLKIALVAAVIVGHAANFYGAGRGWLGVDNVTPSSFASIATLGIAFEIGTMFAMGTFFFMAGWLTTASLTRKGARRFLRGRFVRLGVPLLASLILIMPVSWFVGVLGTTGNPGLAWRASTAALMSLDPGVAWFLTELLIFSAVFVAYRTLRPAPPGAREPLRPRHMLLGIALITVATFVVRLVWPMNSYQPLGLHLWLWPQCLTLFWLGAVGAERGWVDDMRSKVWGLAVVLAVAAVLLMVAGWIVSGASLVFQPFYGGWGWQAAGTAIIEGTLSVSLTVILLDLFRGHFNRQDRLAAAMSRDAYAAFILQAPLLVVGALLLRPVPVIGELKFAVLALAAVAGTFAAVHVLRQRVAFIRWIA